MTMWGKRFENDDDEVPEELRGKSPKEVAAALKKARELETKAAEVEETRLASEKIANDAKVEIDALKARNAELEARPNPNDPPPTPDEPASPWVDPQKFVADQTKGIAAVALNSGMMTARMYFTQNLSGRDQKIFKKYEGEVNGVVNTFAPETRVMPQSWLNAFMYVKGLHDMDIHKAESTNTDFFSETPSRGQQPEDEPQDKLTEEESAMCKAMHWDEAGYLKQKKNQSIHQSSKGAYARFPVPTKSA